MSEENQELNQETVSEELNLEKKIELDKASKPEAYKEEEPQADVDGLIKKKNQLLNETKQERLKRQKLEEELNSLKAMLRKQEDEKLEEKQEYKTLWENTQREKEEIKEQYYSLQNSLVKEKKIKEFNKVLGNSLSKERYYDFVNFNDIIVDEDGTINKDSVKYAVNLFRENYPELVSRNDFPKVGSQAPSNNRLQTGLDMSSKDARRNAKAKLLRK